MLCRLENWVFSFAFLRCGFYWLLFVLRLHWDSHYRKTILRWSFAASRKFPICRRSLENRGSFSRNYFRLRKHEIIWIVKKDIKCHWWRVFCSGLICWVFFGFESRLVLSGRVYSLVQVHVLARIPINSLLHKNTLALLVRLRRLRVWILSRHICGLAECLRHHHTCRCLAANAKFAVLLNKLVSWNLVAKNDTWILRVQFLFALLPVDRRPAFGQWVLQSLRRHLSPDGTFRFCAYFLAATLGLASRWSSRCGCVLGRIKSILFRLTRKENVCLVRTAGSQVFVDHTCVESGFLLSDFGMLLGMQRYLVVGGDSCWCH